MAKPKRRLPGIECVRSGGRWKWRARVMVQGQIRTGTLRDTQEEASSDRPGLKTFRATTLGEALDAVIADARRRGIAEKTIRGSYEFPRRAILKVWEPSDLLTACTTDDVLWLIKEFKAAGRAPRTIKQGYLRILHRAFELAGVESPVPQARRDARQMLNQAPDPMPWFLPEEFGNLIQRVRNYVPTDSETRKAMPLRTQERDADILTLIGCTAIRFGELTRVEARDFDLERGTLTIRQAKVRSQPRVQPLPNVAVEAARRLVRRLRPGDRLIAGHTLNALFERWKRRLDEPRLNGRALRRSHATGLLLGGATLADVRDQMGHHHASTQTVRYLEAVEAHKRSHVTRLAEAAFGSSPSADEQDEA